MKYLLFGSIVFLILAGKSPKNEIIYLDFLNHTGVTYTLGDSLQQNPLKYKTMHFLVKQRNGDKIKVDDLDEYIRMNKTIKEALDQNYHDVEVIFLKSSGNTDNLLRVKSQKALTLCFNDVIAEYYWNEKRIASRYLIKDGWPKDGEKLKIVEVDN